MRARSLVPIVLVACVTLLGYAIWVYPPVETPERQTSHKKSGAVEGQKPSLPSTLRNLFNGAGTDQAPLSEMQRLLSDAKVLSEPALHHPQTFVECLSRHFPIDSLSRGEQSEAVVKRLRQIYEIIGQPASRPVVNGRLDPSAGLGVYLNVMLRDDSSPDARKVFCKVIHNLLSLLAANPQEKMYVFFLGQIFSDSWQGWAEAKNGDAVRALDVWRTFDIFRYLADNKPAQSEAIKIRIQYMNKGRK